MHNEEKRNEILLNEEVKFIGLIEFVKNINRKLQKPIKLKEINDILGLYPSSQNDPNAAHIMIFKFKGNWKLSYDLTYNLIISKKPKILLKEQKKT